MPEARSRLYQWKARARILLAIALPISPAPITTTTSLIYMAQPASTSRATNRSRLKAMSLLQIRGSLLGRVDRISARRESATGRRLARDLDQRPG